VLADRERLERQFYQVQKMETVGRLAGGIAHDFNNILTAIVGFGTLIAEQVAGNDEAARNAAEILAAANRASALTRQLLAFGRRQVLHPTRLDLNETVHSLAGMLRQLIGEHIDLQIVCKADLPPIRADMSQLESALANLVINARDAMPRGGRLTIETTDVVHDDDYCAAHVGVRPGHYARLSVTDTGVGMSQQVQARIFEPFFTTKGQGKGTGLGLSTVFGIVQKSGGNIWVHSEPGVGTTFKIYLPRVDAAVDEPRAAPLPVALQGTETILLVEDDDQVRSVAVNILTRFGYHVLSAHLPDAAMQLCANHPGMIDLLLTDVVMPQMSGPELVRRLISLRPNMKVICMSGYTDDSVVRHGVAEAGHAYLQKPITPRLLATKVRAVLDEARSRSS